MDRPDYSFELEPQLVFGPFDPPGAGSEDGLGAGVRGTLELARDGFVPKLNDSVGLGFGVAWVRYERDDRYRDYCTRYVPGIQDTRICSEVGGNAGDRDYFVVPVVMQWNFWLRPRWSVFGEPGFALYLNDSDLDIQPLVLYAGGRFHFSDRLALTMRVGFPTVSVGLSLLL